MLTARLEAEAIGALCGVTIQLQGDYEADIDIHMKIIHASRSSNAWLQHAPPPKQTKHVVFDQVGDASVICESGSSVRPVSLKSLTAPVWLRDVGAGLDVRSERPAVQARSERVDDVHRSRV